MASTQTYKVAADPAAGAAAEGADARVQTLLRLYNTYPQSAPYAALLDMLNTTAQNAVQGSKTLEQASTTYKPLAQYPNTSFARGLQLLSEVIVQGLGLRVGLRNAWRL